jgi:hypothetical protein
MNRAERTTVTLLLLQLLHWHQYQHLADVAASP